MINIGDELVFKRDLDDIYREGDSVEVHDIDYVGIRGEFEFLIQLPGDMYYYDDETTIWVSQTYFDLPKVDFLGYNYNLCDRVKYLVKPVHKLIKEGWKKNEKGHLKKDTAYYTFTKEKKETCGEIRTGNLIYNPKGNVCVRDSENSWNYDQSMIEIIIPNETVKYKPFTANIGNITVNGNNNGCVKINSRYPSFDNREVDELLKKLLIYKNWIVEDL